ncbi:MAG: deoxyribonuclease IV [Parcubacteria group bacterium]|nr:deoxyribonuclease IV [Parcubacteria group bacterium]
MLFGAHVSIAKNIAKAPERAFSLGCEVFQIFSRSPRGGRAPAITSNTISELNLNLKKYKQKEFYVHTPYYINLGSSNSRIYYSSISVLKEELERGSKLGAKYLMTHLGSAKDLGEEESFKKVVKGIKEVLKNYKGKTQFLIEIAAGAGAIIGDDFQEIDNIIKEVEKVKSFRNKIGVCFDTAHAFASGYDLRDKKAVKKTFDDFDKTIGLGYLKLIHGNDSKVDLDSKKDRHENIGGGKIGMAGFKAIINDKRLKNINMIIETPGDDEKIKDLEVLNKIRNKK